VVLRHRLSRSLSVGLRGHRLRLVRDLATARRAADEGVLACLPDLQHKGLGT
jgi:hypothetical protein